MSASIAAKKAASPPAEKRTDAASLRRFFSGYELKLGRLHEWRRARLDAALKTLGYASERLWLATELSRARR